MGSPPPPRRPSRRAVQLLLALLAPLSGCQPPRGEGTLIIASRSRIDSLDPAKASRVGQLQVLSALGDPLYAILSDGRLEPRQATALPRRSADGLSREVPAARWWSSVLMLIPLGIAAAMVLQAPQLQWWVVGGLSLFGFAFAINSSVHSYLVLAYAGSEKAAEDVGFYYAANALGRFIGTLLSGLLYQWGGLMYALLGSALMLAVCWLATLRLPVSPTVGLQHRTPTAKAPP